jgi:hypothetical protein
VATGHWRLPVSQNLLNPEPLEPNLLNLLNLNQRKDPPMRTFIAGVVFGVALVAGTVTLMGQGWIAGNSRIFELRTYTVPPGGSDKLHKTFKEPITRLFTKHGINVIGYWVPTDKPDMYIYLLAFPNRDAAKASWAAFLADPEWKATSKETGRLSATVESTFMAPTEYSPMK